MLTELPQKESLGNIHVGSTREYVGSTRRFVWSTGSIGESTGVRSIAGSTGSSQWEYGTMGVRGIQEYPNNIPIIGNLVQIFTLLLTRYPYPSLFSSMH